MGGESGSSLLTAEIRRQTQLGYDKAFPAKVFLRECGSRRFQQFLMSNNDFSSLILNGCFDGDEGFITGQVMEDRKRCR